MAETEFIGPGGIVRQTILNNQGQAVISPATTQWATAGTLKPEAVVASSTPQQVAQAGSFYGPPTTAYEWKVDEQAIQHVHGRDCYCLFKIYTIYKYFPKLQAVKRPRTGR